MAFYALMITGTNVCVRVAMQDLSLAQTVFFRFLFGLIFLLPLMARRRFTLFRTGQLRLQALRSVLQMASMAFFYWGLALSAFAKATALTFTAPLFAAVLAVVFFRERLMPSRVAALVVGFAGTIVIVRPGDLGIDSGAVAVLLSCLLGAINAVLTKLFRPSESSLTIIFYTNLIALPVTFVAALFFWVPPTLEVLAWMAGAGFFASLGHVAYVQAFKVADVTAVLPADYTKLPWAALLGFALFKEVPTVWTWLGGTMIFAAVILLALRERQDSRKAVN